MLAAVAGGPGAAGCVVVSRAGNVPSVPELPVPNYPTSTRTSGGCESSRLDFSAAHKELAQRLRQHC